jgi:hypothetical protein
MQGFLIRLHVAGIAAFAAVIVVMAATKPPRPVFVNFTNSRTTWIDSPINDTITLGKEGFIQRRCAPAFGEQWGRYEPVWCIWDMAHI